MAGAIWEWFVPLNAVGEDSFNLMDCRRFIVSIYEEDWSADLIFFRLKSAAAEGRWVKYTMDDEEDSEGRTLVRRFVECHPEEVAHTLLTRRTYGARLPEGMEDLRKYFDPEEYQRWAKEKGVAVAGQPQLSKPTWNGTDLTLDGRVCVSYSKKSGKVQQAVLEALSRNDWQPVEAKILDKFGNLKKTIAYINKKMKFVRLFIKDGLIHARRSSDQ